MAVHGIDSFKGSFQGGARGTLFDVTLTPPVEANSGTEASRLKFHCKGASLPASSVAEILVPFRGRDLKINGKRTFENWNMTVINDQDMKLRAMFEKWSHAMTEHGVFVANEAYTGLGSSTAGGKAKGFAGYMCDLNVTQLDMRHDPVRKYTIVGAWPTNVAAITLGSGEEGIEEFEVSLAYQYWQSTGSGNPITDVTSGKEPVVVDDPGQRQRPGLNGD